MDDDETVLDISDEAVLAGISEVRRFMPDIGVLVYRAVRAAAPIIVAVELRRLAADPQNLFMSGADSEILIDRANELDPQ